MVFLDDKVSRAWVGVANIRPFNGEEYIKETGSVSQLIEVLQSIVLVTCLKIDVDLHVYTPSV